jgi:hypothetical protein
MNPDLIRAAVLNGRFTEATILYWVEWLVTRDATPPDLEDLLDFIAMMEDDVSDGLTELIPKEWYPDE